MMGIKSIYFPMTRKKEYFRKKLYLENFQLANYEIIPTLIELNGHGLAPE